MMSLLATLAGCPPTDLVAGSASTSDTPGAATTSGDEGGAGVTASTAGAPTTGGSGAGGTDTGDGATTGEPIDPGGEVTTGAGSTTTGAGTTGAGTTGEAWAPKGCPDLYAQELLPTFALEVTPEVLSGLEEEWAAADDEDLTKFPLASFTYGDITITNASIRLRGNADHWPTQGKMQFEVQFNAFDKDARFMGLRQVLFDAAEFNRSFLRDRLALSILRDAGVPAPCANNARVVLNGEYYGLFTSIEKVDREFLERHFEDAGGNLYKRGGGGSFGWSKKTNEDDPDMSDMEALKAAEDLDALLAVLDLEQSVLEWAGEAVIPNRDGLWAGGLNGYAYHDPKTGLFFMIPWDLDDSFTRLSPDVDPITYKKPAEVFHGRPFYDIALADPTWRGKYVAAVGHAVAQAYDKDVLQQRIDAWSAQIAEAVIEDPNRPFTVKQHEDQVEEMREFVALRAEFLKGWLE